MFRMILETQWKWTRAVVLLATVLGFALPLASLQGASDAYNAGDFVRRMQVWGVAYAILAAGIGLTVGLAAWAHDQRGRHLYALILPVSRARYVLMRLGAGGTFLLGPIAGVLLGALGVALFANLPAGLHAYPIALTLRFAFAAAVAYALFFSVASATQKTAGIILGVIAAAILAQYGLQLINVNYPLLSRIGDVLFSAPGVFSVFTGRWSLVDA